MKKKINISNLIFFIFAILTLFYILIGFLSRKIVVNISDSSPLGFYYVLKDKDLKKGDYVLINIDEKYKELLNSKQRNMKLIKKISGVPGDNIQINKNKLYINNKFINNVNSELVNSDINYILKDNEYFVLGNSNLSLDSKIMGAINNSNIISKLMLLKEIK